MMRHSSDFIRDLDFVILKNDQIIGNIMYTLSHLLNERNERLDTITFGPVSIAPEYQRQGYGSELIKYSMNKAMENGYNAIIIHGNPGNYCKHGFFGSKKFRISTPEGKYPCALLVKPLKEDMFETGQWRFHESEVFDLDYSGFEQYDNTFDRMAKEDRYTQEEFRILSTAYIDS